MIPTTANPDANVATTADSRQSALEPIQELIPVCSTEVLETMFFSTADPASDYPPEEIESFEQLPAYMVVVDFLGRPSGRFWIRATRATAAALAADFLGLDRDEIDDERSLQTVLELSNMLCGSVVSRVESDAAFALNPPRLLEVGETAEPNPTHWARFVVEGGLVEVACTLA